MLEMVIIGQGAIARYVADALEGQDAARITAVLCRPGREDAAREMFGAKAQVVSDAARIRPPIRLALDCAGHAALAEHGPALLQNGIDVITVSTGALADVELAGKLEAAARSGNARLHLAAGAVGALDALGAAKLGGLDQVTYTGRKPPSGWKGSPAEEVLDLDTLETEAVHFDGTAREAALRYPKNANVAATVAMAGIGLDETEVRLIADPAVNKNCHAIEARGAFGTFTFSIEGNTLPESPRTSALAAMSAAKAVVDRISRIVV